MRKTRKGKIFFGCSLFPKCDFATWDEPVNQPCPDCDRKFLLKHSAVKGKPYLHCSNEECSYKKILEEEKIWEKKSNSSGVGEDL